MRQTTLLPACARRFWEENARHIKPPLQREVEGDAISLPQSWLRVFRSVNAVHLPHGVKQERETTAVWSEKCVARCGSEYDEMRMITTRFVRVLQRCAAPLCTHFLLIFQEVRSASKTCNQLYGKRQDCHHHLSRND